MTHGLFQEGTYAIFIIFQRLSLTHLQLIALNVFNAYRHQLSLLHDNISAFESFESFEAEFQVEQWLRRLNNRQKLLSLVQVNTVHP